MDAVGSRRWKGHCPQNCGGQIARGQIGKLRRHAWTHAHKCRSSYRSGRSGVAQDGWDLAGFRVSQEPREWGSFVSCVLFYTLTFTMSLAH